jgi:hypothetical protein
MYLARSSFAAGFMACGKWFRLNVAAADWPCGGWGNSGDEKGRRL